jgi:hypothetical protein
MAFAPLGSNGWFLRRNKEVNLFEEKIIKDLAEKY